MFPLRPLLPSRASNPVDTALLLTINTSFTNALHLFLAFLGLCGFPSCEVNVVCTHSSGCDSSVIFHLVSPTVIVTALRGYASFGLHVLLVLHLLFFQSRVFPRFAPPPLYPSMHLLRKRVILRPRIDVFNVEPHLSRYSMLDCVVSSRRADTGGGGGGGCCGSNDVTLERLQPVLDGGISGVGPDTWCFYE